ncbi:MAG: hypothetical protein JW839_22400 [Candidatus Lokiarchaeota archaeon]|nr:hypothetical protein [Candidatus Lokiarchaeota archaeon]
MHTRKRTANRLEPPRPTSITLAALIAISGFLIPYIGFFVYAMEDYNRISYESPAPDPSTFVDINSSRLYAMANWYEDNIAKYHMPHDMIVETRFNANTTVGTPTSYGGFTDSAEWTGHYLMAEAFRYATCQRDGNTTHASQALANITKTLQGIDKILHVSPNGGMARYAWPLAQYPGTVRDNRYLGSWNGQYYIYEDDTSRDMHNGIIMGLGFAYLLVDDAAVRATVARLVSDMLDYFLDRGWLYVNPEGDPNGTDLDDGFWLGGTNGLWTLAYLKVGELVNSTRYSLLYREYAIDRDYAHRSSFAAFSRANTVQSYYGLLLDWELMFALATLETEPNLKALYLHHMDQMYHLTKNDRTAIFNAMWLALEDIDRTNQPAGMTVIEDVGDCLMRFYSAPQRFPGRDYKVANPGQESPVAVKWRDFFTDDIGGTLYPFWELLFKFPVVSDTPLTPDRREQTDFLWSRSPFSLGAGGNGYFEGPGNDFTVVYWLCRYYDIIAPPTDYQATIEVHYG